LQYWGLHRDLKLLHNSHLFVFLILHFSLNWVSAPILYFEVALEGVLREEAAELRQLATLNNADIQLEKGALDLGTHKHFHFSRLGTHLRLQLDSVVVGARYARADL